MSETTQITIEDIVSPKDLKEAVKLAKKNYETFSRGKAVTHTDDTFLDWVLSINFGTNGKFWLELSNPFTSIFVTTTDTQSAGSITGEAVVLADKNAAQLVIDGKRELMIIDNQFDILRAEAELEQLLPSLQPIMQGLLASFVETHS